jgi:hypothetical protein
VAEKLLGKKDGDGCRYEKSGGESRDTAVLQPEDCGNESLGHVARCVVGVREVRMRWLFVGAKNAILNPGDFSTKRSSGSSHNGF